MLFRSLPGLQAAFVDLGLEKAGFLHVEDVESQSLLDSIGEDMDDEDEDPRGGSSGESKPIDQLLKVGQEVLVQVTKEPISTKGARLTCHLSFAGPFLVCMPGTSFIGVSKKARDPQQRRALKRMIRELKSPECGYIVRTNGLNESEAEFAKQIKAGAILPTIGPGKGASGPKVGDIKVFPNGKRGKWDGKGWVAQ